MHINNKNKMFNIIKIEHRIVNASNLEATIVKVSEKIHHLLVNLLMFSNNTLRVAVRHCDSHDGETIFIN